MGIIGEMSIEMGLSTDVPVGEGNPVEVTALGHYENKDGKKWQRNVLFPSRFQGNITVWGVDESFAEMLTGMIRALQPQIVLETGTNRGRSTKAIAQGLALNDRGLMYTVDVEDHNIHTSGALEEDQKQRVRFIQGKTPEVFDDFVLKELYGIDFAFLDGVHTAEGVSAELKYVEEHCSDECTVLIDNTRDDGWADLTEFMVNYKDHPSITIPTMSGTTIIQMRK
tara:strand:+ start:1011 stop:1685 length:675 start_codon:yes stop_codon:yes gene_type:complete